MTNILVLDQGSTDATAEVCANYGVEIVQLGEPHTYTQASNIGMAIAKRRNLPYLCISNNDITFRTDVLSELLTEMEKDPFLGIVAPSQIIIDDAQGLNTLSYRVYWDLDKVDFFHDTKPPDQTVERVEADFCELTCALIRMSALERIGGLDDEYGFYHEDADLGLRLRKAGFNCAYLPKSQIDHYSGSTIEQGKFTRRSTYIAKNKIYFAQKHLGLGVAPWLDDGLEQEFNQYDKNVRRSLRLYGLEHEGAPNLHFSSSSAQGDGFLHTTFYAPRIPARWILEKDRHQAIFTPFEPMRQVFLDAGFPQVFYIPFGVDTDTFHPWVDTRQLRDEMTFLAFVDGVESRSLDLLQDAWARFRTSGRAAWLVLFGSRASSCIGTTPDVKYCNKYFEITEYRSEGILAYEALSPLSARQLARLYRSVDFTIFVSLVPNACAVFESAAVGTPCILANEVRAAFNFPGIISFHRGGEDGGVENLARCLDETFHMGEANKCILQSDSVRGVRSRFTLRHTAIGFEAALASFQTRDSSAIVESLKRRSPAAQAIALANGSETRADVWRRNASSMVARRVKTLGRLTLQLGAEWEEKGFARAGRSMASEFGRFFSYRTSNFRGNSSRLLDSAKMKIDALRRHDVPVKGSTLLIGYIDAQLGLGQSSRGLATAMLQTGQLFSIHPFTVGVEDRRGEAFLPECYDQMRTHEVNIIEVATNELPTVFKHVEGHRLTRSYNILRTYWELGKAPEAWKPILSLVNEIWAPNAFVAQSLRSVFDGPIAVIPPCVQIPELELETREHFGLEKDRYYFLFSFDYHSFPQRKNPLAVVNAFREAFPDLATNVGLIVKSTGAEKHFPQIKEALLAASYYDERITVIDKSLTRSEMLSLLHAADCYVSLHRSEGFGLGMAEALAMAKPVIATNYSGNTEFLTHETGYPVPFYLRRILPDEYVHTEGQVWAEPSERACAADMKHVFKNRDDALLRGLAGKRFIEARFGPENVGRLISERLQDIFTLRRAL